MLLISGDIEQNPGPVSREEFKGMNRGQRGRVTKQDREQLLTEMVEDEAGDATNNDVLAELKQIREELKEIKDLKISVEGQQKKITDLEKEVKTLKDTVIAQQKFLEDIDGDKRCKKLIFLGVTEDNTADDEKVNGVLNQLNILREVEVDSVERLGKKREAEGDEVVVHKRPLLVTVNSRIMRNNVLKNAKNLKDVEEGNWMKTVFIKADEIRKEMKRLNDVFKHERDKAENVGAEIKFDRKARKITKNGQIVDEFQLTSLFQ